MDWKPLNENIIRSIVNTVNSYQSLVATCTSTSKTAGDIVHMSATPTGGIASYTVVFKKDATVLSQIVGVAEAQIKTYDYTTVTADISTTPHVFSVTITDSCTGTGGPKTNTESCSITVVAPVVICNTPAVNLVVS